MRGPLRSKEQEAPLPRTAQRVRRA